MITGQDLAGTNSTTETVDSARSSARVVPPTPAVIMRSHSTRIVHEGDDQDLVCSCKSLNSYTLWLKVQSFISEIVNNSLNSMILHSRAERRTDERR